MAKIHEHLKTRIGTFAPTVITADTSRLSAGDQRALAKVIEAAKIIDCIFEKKQLFAGNDEVKKRLQKSKSKIGRLRLEMFNIHRGPWDSINGEAFVKGVPAKQPDHCTYYPADLTEQEWEARLAELPAGSPERDQFESFYTVIRRDQSGKLIAVPYSEAYGTELKEAAKLLHEAAALTDNPSLAKFLTSRADAFLSNKYFDSEVAWMDLDSPLHVTIGPYETYSDGFKGLKAAFEAYISLTDQEETAKLHLWESLMQKLEDNLPYINPAHRNPNVAAKAPIRVVNEIYAAGEGRQGIMSAAYNLPNDPDVIAAKGSAKILKKNVQREKFDQVLRLIARRVLSPIDQALLLFEAFFTHILSHEVLHGIGPHQIIVKGKQTTVRVRLKELYSKIEEAKADICALWALRFCMDAGIFSNELLRPLYTTYLASAFRTIRFGTDDHAIGMYIQLNFLREEGAFTYDPATKTFAVDESKIKGAVERLTSIILDIEGNGDYQAAKALIAKYNYVHQDIQLVLNDLASVPIDIRPQYPVAEEILRPRRARK
jgi:hypothetical protein